MAALSSDQQVETIALYQNGLSARQVAEHFQVSIGAVYYVLRHKNIDRRLIKESNQILYEAKPLSYVLKENLSRQEQDLKLAAVMLYWAEGYKISKSTIDFANSDPAMAALFIRFLRQICGVDESKIRCSLYCYEGQNIEELTDFWSKLLSVSEDRFTKPYIKIGDSGVRGPRMIHGLVHVRYCDKKLLQQLLRWIEEYQHISVGGGVGQSHGTVNPAT